MILDFLANARCRNFIQDVRAIRPWHRDRHLPSIYQADVLMRSDLKYDHPTRHVLDDQRTPFKGLIGIVVRLNGILIDPDLKTFSRPMPFEKFAHVELGVG